MSPDKTPSGDHRTADTSLRNFVMALLAVSAVVVIAMFLIQSAAG